MLLQELAEKKLIRPQNWLLANTHYLTVMGSIAYGTNTDTSDFDVYGFAIPKKEDIFPHLAGVIVGFGKQGPEPKDLDWSQHHIFDADAVGGKGREYDFTVFNIVRYFNLALDNNPNVIDSLFTASDCVLHCTAIGNMVRDARKVFLHKGCIPKLKGYAFSQLQKAGSQTREGKRADLVDKFGYDPKFLSHVVRLTLQAEQILINGDLDLRRDREQIKAVKRGDITLDEVKTWFNSKELHLQKLYEDSKLPNNPDEGKIRQLLLDCLEHHYGSLDKIVNTVDKSEQALKDIRVILDKAGI